MGRRCVKTSPFFMYFCYKLKSMLINDIYIKIQAVMQKMNRGFVDPVSFNSAIDYVVSKIYNSIVDDLVRTRNRAIRGYVDRNFYDQIKHLKSTLSTLYVEAELVLDPSEAFFLYPDDFSTDDVMVYKGKPVAPVDVAEALSRANIGLLSNLDEEFITYLKDKQGLITLPMLTPADIAANPLTLFYFKTPVQAVWAYTVVSGKPVFDAANSIDIELNRSYLDEIVRETLVYLGVEVKDFTTAQLINAEEQIVNKESNSIQ